jgi:hypothetical protein
MSEGRPRGSGDKGRSTSGKEEALGRKLGKAQQRKTYRESFKRVKHGHGTRSIKKKDESALAR